MYPNINDIVLEMSSDYSSEEIGKIFSESLLKKKLDKLAFIYVNNDVSERRLQSSVMSGIKSSMASTLIFPYEFKEINFANCGIVNNNSILGSICSVIESRGEGAFEDISVAITKGSLEYLKKVPLAKYMNAHQFKEYRAIKSEIQKLL